MAKEIVNLTDATFNDEVEAAGSKPMLIDFWAPWCAPCKMMGPILDQVAKKLGDKVVIAKLNTDENPMVANALGIRAIPTMVVLKDTEIADVLVGVKPAAELISKLNSMLPSDSGAAAH